MPDIADTKAKQSAWSGPLMTPRQQEKLNKSVVWSIERIGLPAVLVVAFMAMQWQQNEKNDARQERQAVSTMATQERQADALDKITDQHGQMVKLMHDNAANTADNGETLKEIKEAIEKNGM